MIQLIYQKEREVTQMAKAEFLRRWRTDRDFKFDMMAKGIRVIQNNVIFFNPDGSVKAVAGNYIK